MTTSVTADSIFDCPGCGGSQRLGDMIMATGTLIPILIRHLGIGATDPAWVCRDCAEAAGLITM